MVARYASYKNDMVESPIGGYVRYEDVWRFIDVEERDKIQRYHPDRFNQTNTLMIPKEDGHFVTYWDHVREMVVVYEYAVTKINKINQMMVDLIAKFKIKYGEDLFEGNVEGKP
jgi:hypothetical protein